MDQIIHNDDIAANHDTDGHQKEKDEPHKVDWVVTAKVNDILHFETGGKVGAMIGVVHGENKGNGAAKSHAPYTKTSHDGFGDVFELLTMLWLDNGHVAVCAYKSKQPQSHARVENSERCTDPAENISKGPVVQVVVGHSEGKLQDKDEVYYSNVYHVDCDRVPLFGRQSKHP